MYIILSTLRTLSSPCELTWESNYHYNTVSLSGLMYYVCRSITEDFFLYKWEFHCEVLIGKVSTSFYCLYVLVLVSKMKFHISSNSVAYVFITGFKQFDFDSTLVYLSSRFFCFVFVELLGSVDL